jgi:hypothetical protein
MKTLNKLRCRMQVHIRWVFNFLVVDLDCQKADWYICLLNNSSVKWMTDRLFVMSVG